MPSLFNYIFPYFSNSTHINSNPLQFLSILPLSRSHSLYRSYSSLDCTSLDFCTLSIPSLFNYTLLALYIPFLTPFNSIPFDSSLFILPFLHYINSIFLRLHPFLYTYSIIFFDYDFILIIFSLSITPFISFHRFYRNFRRYPSFVKNNRKNSNPRRGSSNIREANKPHQQSLKTHNVESLKTHRSACRTGPVASIPDNVVEIAPSTSKSLK